MKSNIKKKSIYSISIIMMMFILMLIPSVHAEVTVNRTIKNDTVHTGDVVKVIVEIQNDNVSRSLSLQETIPSGWELTRNDDDADTFKPNSKEWVWIGMSRGSPHVVLYNITIPSDANVGTYNISGNITTNATGNNSTIKIPVSGDNKITIINKTSDKKNGSFDFGVSPESLTVNAGKDALYTLTIKNLDDVSDIYTFTVEKPGNVTTSLSKKSINIDAGNNSSVNLTVRGSITGTFTVNVSAKSSSNSSSIKTVTTTTNIIEEEKKINGSFDFVVDSLSKKISVGANAIYTFIISNLGDKKDTFKIEVSNPDNATYDISKENVTVNAGDNSTLSLTITGLATGTYSVDVRATSKLNNSSTKNITTTTTVFNPLKDGSYNFTIDKTSRSIYVGDDASYTLTLENTGGIEDTYTLKVVNPNNATVDLSRNNVTVDPLNSSNVGLIVSGATTGTFTVNVSAVSKIDKRNIKNISTTTVITDRPVRTGGGSGGGSSGGGTYPTFTATPVKTANATVVPTAVTTTVPATSTTTVATTEKTETPTPESTTASETTKSEAPGFEILLAIGTFAAIYLFRKMK